MSIPQEVAKKISEKNGVIVDLRAVLFELVASCPRNLECGEFSHNRTTFHEADEPCKPRNRYETALKAAESLLSKP